MRFPDDNFKSLHLIQLKCWDIVAFHVRENPIDFRKNPSKVKVKVTENLRKNLKIWGFRTITRKVYIWFNCNLGIWLHITREKSLMIFRQIRPRSRSQWLNLKIWGFRTITSKVYVWFNWNFRILLHIKWERTLLIFGWIRSRSWWPKNFEKIVIHEVSGQ